MAAQSDNAAAYAVRRLAQDMRALHKDPVPGVTAHQDETKPLTVYANLVPATGDYAGIPVHMHLVFPNNYPKHPPSVQLKTPLKHPNVFGGYICLDLLKPYEIGPYQGWSAAYDLGGILRQLYSFLLGDDYIDQEYGESQSRFHYRPASWDLQLAREATCTCGYGQQPAPLPNTPARVPGDTPLVEPASQKTSKRARRKRRAVTDAQPATPSNKPVPELPPDVIRQVLGYANPGAVEACANGSTVDELTQIAVQQRAQEEQRCFFTKTAMDGTTVLGFGVTVTRQGGGSGPVRGLSMAMDLLSEAAFHQHAVRKSAWNVGFEQFLPLALNRTHSERALDALLNTYLGGISDPVGTVEQRLLTALAQLMNSLVVEMAQTDSRQVARHMSDAALQGFCHLHHLLLSAVTLRPELGQHLLDTAQKDVTSFARSQQARSKASCPDLGVLLIKLLLVPKDIMPWSKFAPVFVRELLARQVRWLQHTDLKEPWAARHDSNDGRLEHTFMQSATGLRLVAIEAWFANALARPSSSDTAMQQLTTICQSYDNRGGSPPPDVFRRFHAYAHDVKYMAKWSHWLAAMHLAVRATCVSAAKPVMANILRQAAVDSYHSGYHRPQYQPRRICQYEGWHEHALPLAVMEQEW